MEYKHMERQSLSLAFTKMIITTTMRYHKTSTGMTKTKDD